MGEAQAVKKGGFQFQKFRFPREMIKFSRMFFPKSVDERTFTEASAGVADLIATCSAGRNSLCAKHAAERGVTVEWIEKERDKRIESSREFYRSLCVEVFARLGVDEAFTTLHISLWCVSKALIFATIRNEYTRRNPRRGSKS
jgi:hypothetical protein